MLEGEPSGKGSQAGDREALQAEVDYAKDLANWVKQAPEPPKTMAKTLNDVLGEVNRELGRIYACYRLDKAADRTKDDMVLEVGDKAENEKNYEDLTQAMEALGCPHTG
jgi:hypothetical protein